MSFASGSLVRARGREWVVLPESSDDLLILRPLGGTEDEVTGILPSLEKIESAHFDLPDPTKPGDYRSCRLLRDAVRLGFRSSAGPFRSFGRLGIEPRPYQLVPLLVGLKLDPVRLLIADDVGVGKTIEAGLVARELIDRGEVQHLAVLCPPHLAEQWQTELRLKFNIDAELVLQSTASGLERQCRLNQSIFELFPFVIVSMDFIKSDRRRDEFVRTCPELVIVDEAHTCAFGAAGRGGRHQRHQLLTGLAADPLRHMLLVTATPHSGKEESFRSLLAFLDPDFANLPEDLSGSANQAHRRRLAAHFIQRRRADLRSYLGADTVFPDREEKEETYKLSPKYKALFERVLEYARDTVIDREGNRHRQRVRWWSALALLRSLASSPAAAAETLRTRAGVADTATPEEADEVGSRTVLDLDEDESTERFDAIPGSDPGETLAVDTKERRRLLEMARDAEALKGEGDEKLKKAIDLIRQLVKDGHQPIIFCRFIPTADYLAAELSKSLPKDVEVASVTGLLPPSDREKRVLDLAGAAKHVLVCTDCLSEGINLQDHFDAVFHYDLSWNPTRHEQRDGRVDRYGQPKKTVRVVTYYGTDNQIDGIVLDILIRKHRTIRNSLGISVPVPVDTTQLVEAIFEGLLLREKSGKADQQLILFEEFFKPKREDLFAQWEAVSEREKRSRTMFAQETIKVDEVARELKEARQAIGSRVDVETFVKEALRAHRAVVKDGDPLRVNLKEAPAALRDAVGGNDTLSARFELPVDEDVSYLNRTHPFVEGLANFVMQRALDPITESVARRTGVTMTKAVQRRTTVLLVRFRYHVITKKGAHERTLLAEDCLTLGFTGSTPAAEWLTEDAVESLLEAAPDGNVGPEKANEFLQMVIGEFDPVRSHLQKVAEQRALQLLDAHRRVRAAAQLKGVTYRVEPKLPPDVLGVYVYLPSTSAH